MRVCCVVNGDILGGRSDASRCNSPASGGHVSMARHYGNEARLSQLPRSRLCQIKCNTFTKILYFLLT